LAVARHHHHRWLGKSSFKREWRKPIRSERSFIVFFCFVSFELLWMKLFAFDLIC
jgi:hypothetical protein